MKAWPRILLFFSLMSVPLPVGLAQSGECTGQSAGSIDTKTGKVNLKITEITYRVPGTNGSLDADIFPYIDPAKPDRIQLLISPTEQGQSGYQLDLTPGQYLTYLNAMCGNSLSLTQAPGAAGPQSRPAQARASGAAGIPVQGSQSMTGGDFNGDGLLDSAFVSNTTLQIYLTQANQSSVKGAAYPVGLNSRHVISVDLNHDGKLDLVVADYGSVNQSSPNAGNLWILLGKGDGTFSSGDGAGWTESAIVGGGRFQPRRQHRSGGSESQLRYGFDSVWARRRNVSSPRSL
jgi:hypothetical protein